MRNRAGRKAPANTAAGAGSARPVGNMDTLTFTHNSWLVIASLAVAMIAGFTGLSLTQGLSERSDMQKKVLIALAAVVLGGGIWSMHFVAMLGLQLPVLFYYDSIYTLTSALVAILVVGVALLLLHFTERTRRVLVTAGIIVGLGILAMHYIGMAGLRLCRALYSVEGVALAVIASCGLSVAAFGIAYGRRTQRNLLLGTVVFGLSVFAVHFAAIWGTQFVAISSKGSIGPAVGNEVMAIGVVLTSFVLCGAFLLTGISFISQHGMAAPAAQAVGPHADDEEPADAEQDAPAAKLARIPYEKEGRTHFLDVGAIAAIRAEGHYTNLYTRDAQLFCAWSITEAEKRLRAGPFIKTHRSYLVNPAFVTGFERLKDNGVCHFDVAKLVKVPVSRSRLRAVREALGV